MTSFIKEWDAALRTSYVQNTHFIAFDEYVHTLGTMIETYRKDMNSSIELLNKADKRLIALELQHDSEALQIKARILEE